MSSMTTFKKFFSNGFNVLTRNRNNKNYYLDESLRKLKKELENKEAQLVKKRSQFKTAQKEHENCARGFESLEDDLFMTEEKQKARTIIGQTNPLINHKLDLSRNIEILKWEINNLNNIVEKRRMQYQQLKLEPSELYPGKDSLCFMFRNTQTTSCYNR